VAISNWMKKQAQTSKLLSKQPISVIHSGIDTKLFKAVDRNIARSHFAIETELPIVLMGAQNITESYKGVQFAIDALSILEEKVLIVTFGKSAPVQLPKKHSHIHVGFIMSTAELSLLYSIADVFLATSVAEAFGKTMAEAQACGVPVVCFTGTGPEDIVRHKVTGYLAAFKNVESIVQGIDFVLKSNLPSEDIRAHAIANFDIDICTRKYADVYTQLLSYNEQKSR
jgi:glycosyltransferase involved in cell wall biosynthesis